MIPRLIRTTYLLGTVWDALSTKSPGAHCAVTTISPHLSIIALGPKSSTGVAPSYVYSNIFAAKKMRCAVPTPSWLNLKEQIYYKRGQFFSNFFCEPSVKYLINYVSFACAYFRNVNGKNTRYICVLPFEYLGQSILCVNQVTFYSILELKQCPRCQCFFNFFQHLS